MPMRHDDKKDSFNNKIFIFSYFTGVYSMGFRSPSKIQEIALPSLLANPPSKLNLFSEYNFQNNLLY
jgi:hypothetical protein